MGEPKGRLPDITAVERMTARTLILGTIAALAGALITRLTPVR